MASDFETVIAKCDGCKFEEECREMPPCILDAYNKGRADCLDEFADWVLYNFAPLYTKEELINSFKEEIKEQKK